MKKLIQGIVEFRQKVQTDYRLAFGKLATGQAPDALFIACSDSRVVPNTFASTNPGELFVLRNIGNIIPPCGCEGISTSDESEAAALEFSVLILNVFDIIVCGHSECGAMKALMDDREKVPYPHLKNWLRHGDEALERLRAGVTLDASLSPANQLSQLNVLLQLEHLKSYPAVRERVENGDLLLHGWWFDIAKADVYAFDEAAKKFILIDEKSAPRLLERLPR
jgi:carbonic anhydrase